jgi:hypothetical protein
MQRKKILLTRLISFYLAKRVASHFYRSDNISQQTPPPINPGSDSTAKGLVANLTKNAGAAAKLVGLQAERTRLTTLTLPAAYRTLGNDCVQQKRHLDGVKELIEQLQAVVSEIKALSEISKPQASNQSFTDKAKAAGKHAVDLARRKQLEMKRESLCGDVGKVIYETYKESSGSKDLVTPIQAALQRVAELDSEIAKVEKGSWITRKYLLFMAAGIAVTVIVALFFPGGKSTANMYAKYSQQEKGVSWEISGGPTYDQNEMVEIAKKFTVAKNRSSWSVEDAIRVLGDPTTIRRFNYASNNPESLNNSGIAESVKTRWKSDFDTLKYEGKKDPESNFITMSFRDGLLDESMPPTFNIK